MKRGGRDGFYGFQWRQMILPAMVLAVGLTLTVAGWNLTAQWIAAEARATLERRGESLHGALVRRMALYEQALRASAAYIHVSNTSSIHDWVAFVERQGLDTNFPGMPALAYAPVVRRDQAASFVEQARADGLYWFRLWPADDQDIMVPNRFTAPLNPANMRALGFDMYQNPLRHDAMDAARDSGRTAITAQVTLKIDPERGAEVAFIAYAPVYARGLPIETVEERRAALSGFTLAPIRLPTLVSQLLAEEASDAVIRIYDGPDPDKDAEMYVSAGAPQVERWLRRDVTFSNRTWAVLYGFRPGAVRPHDNVLPWVVIGLGTSVSLLLALLVGNLVNARGNAQAIAAHMTRALRDSEAKLKAVFDNSMQFQSLLTPEGRLVAVNPTALALVGGDLATVENKLFWEVSWLDVPEEKERCRAALAVTARGEWSRLEILRHTPDGDEMWVDCSFRPVMGETGAVAWIVAEGRDVTERHRREELQNRAVAELTRSNQELERFAHVAAHDLQEPCRTIVSYAQLLERRAAPVLDDSGREFLSFLISGAHRMRDLVTDLLAYSRVRAKEAPFETVDCGKVLSAVRADLQRTILEAGARLEVGRLPMVAGDPAQIGQLFLNLLGNALKFRDHERGCLIQVSAERQGDEWLFRVADNGIGIAPAYHERVFEIFQRLHGPDRYPGTGIGLAICRRVVERHGGRLWIESEEGRGACFCFTLPAQD